MNFSDAVLVLIFVICGNKVWSQFFECFQDGGYDPDEGPVTDLHFTWLGILQYIHIKNGTPHYYRAPRVVLVAKQFVLSTAVDASVIPDGYALGNIVFGEYERDEEECKLTVEDVAAGVDCDPAVLIMPIADVLLHPEFKHFHAKNSLALLKLITPISSNYVVPACIPFKDFVIDKRTSRVRLEKLFYIDFPTDVPRDFVDEEKEVQKLSLLPRELCVLYDYPNNKSSSAFIKDRMGCSTGCGLHSGAPSLVHEHTGHWSIVALALGGPPCPDPLRPRRPPPPPHHILLYPYVPWISAAITGKALGVFAKDDPFGYTMSRATPYDYVGHQWVGHWWMGGVRCYDRGEMAEDIFKFYKEVFQVSPQPHSSALVNYYLELHSPQNAIITCVKVGMPYRYSKPHVTNLDTVQVRVTVPLIRLFSMYRFQIEAFAYNDTFPEERWDSATVCSSDDSECIAMHQPPPDVGTTDHGGVYPGGWKPEPGYKPPPGFMPGHQPGTGGQAVGAPRPPGFPGQPGAPGAPPGFNPGAPGVPPMPGDLAVP